MKRLLRYGLAVLISYMPTNRLRCILYNLLLGYTVRRSRIGIGTIIATAAAKIEGASIGCGNKFTGPMSVQISSGANICKDNIFACGEWVLQAEFQECGYECALILQENTLIADAHFFDLAGRFVLGKDSWIAGRGSQFWTHGAGVSDRNIAIGEGCYIGSAVRFAPGCQISDNTLVAMGSVVTGKVEQPNLMIAGIPAKVIKENYDWKTRKSLTTSPTHSENPSAIS
ncbi:acyltransferase [Altericista sp. CCNU0014]|uniref:acyltransferase n=1 Tax=Altericista sp. CCNU0014 TaxID=3082949 RepID=UPI00384B565A